MLFPSPHCPGADMLLRAFSLNTSKVNDYILDGGMIRISAGMLALYVNRFHTFSDLKKQNFGT